MASHRIVCTEQEPVTYPSTHAHIVAVGTGSDPNQATNRWTLAQVLAGMDRGDTFYTQGASSGRTARVVPVECGSCGHRIIRSTADAVWDNNLDSLRRCSF